MVGDSWSPVGDAWAPHNPIHLDPGFGAKRPPPAFPDHRAGRSASAFYRQQDGRLRRLAGVCPTPIGTSDTCPLPHFPHPGDPPPAVRRGSPVARPCAVDGDMEGDGEGKPRIAQGMFKCSAARSGLG